MKNILLSLIIFISSSANAFTETEWKEFITETIETKEDMTWTYNVEKLKEHQGRIKTEDILILKKLAKEEDVQISQGSKYLLATQGEKSNAFLFDNYLNDPDLKNGLYYLSFNFVNTINKELFWSLINDKEVISRSTLKEEFKSCKTFKDYHAQGGKDFTFESYDDFFEQRNIVENYTNSDLFTLELELSEIVYPVTITFYNNRYIVQALNDDKCLKPNDSPNYIEMQKIMALYKQYQKPALLKTVCDDINSNSLLKSRFNYFCIGLK